MQEVYYTYDQLNRLVQVASNRLNIKYAYDPLSRKIARYTLETECYLYDGEHEIGAFIGGSPKQLRIPGLGPKQAPSTVAIELDQKAYAPLPDFQGNISRLVDSSKKRIAEYAFTAFGRPKSLKEDVFNPWRYAAKRLDIDTGLIDFGKRIYDSHLSRWLTTDPAGFIDDLNLYAYVRNNPLGYIDYQGNTPLILSSPNSDA